RGGWIGFPPPLWSSNGFWRFSDACREIPPDATGTIENMPGIGNSPTHWTSRESFGETQLQLEITSSNFLSTLQSLREKTRAAAGRERDQAAPGKLWMIRVSRSLSS